MFPFCISFSTGLNFIVVAHSYIYYVSTRVPLGLVQLVQVCLSAYLLLPVFYCGILSAGILATFSLIGLYTIAASFYHINKVLATSLNRHRKIESKPLAIAFLTQTTRIVLTEHNRMTDYVNWGSVLWSGLLTTFAVSNIPISMYPIIHIAYNSEQGSFIEKVAFISISICQVAAFLLTMGPMTTFTENAHASARFINPLQMKLNDGGHTLLKWKVAMFYEKVASSDNKIAYQAGPFGQVTKSNLFQVCLFCIEKRLFSKSSFVPVHFHVHGLRHIHHELGGKQKNCLIMYLSKINWISITTNENNDKIFYWDRNIKEDVQKYRFLPLH